VHRAPRARCGLARSTHSIASTIGLAQLDIFEEGVDLRRVVIGHSDMSIPTILALIGRGAPSSSTRSAERRSNGRASG
jgi:predicted metal-dependent phosphotriesterase family hydrolase